MPPLTRRLKAVKRPPKRGVPLTPGMPPPSDQGDLHPRWHHPWSPQTPKPRGPSRIGVTLKGLKVPLNREVSPPVITNGFSSYVNIFLRISFCFPKLYFYAY